MKRTARVPTQWLGYPVIVKRGRPYLIVTQRKWEQLIHELACKIIKAQYKPDFIVGIAKGGQWASFFAAELGVDWGLWAIRRYRKLLGHLADEGGKKIDTAPHITTYSDCLERLARGESLDLLVVEDLTDKGDTFKHALLELRARYGERFQVRTACLWRKKSGFLVDYFVDEISPEPVTGKMPWIVKAEEDMFKRIFRGVPMRGWKKNNRK